MLFTTMALLALRCASSLKPARPLRVLVLHGKGGTAASMEQYFEPIAAALPECDFSFANAPYAAGRGAAWWTLPPGTRSFEAKAYGGVDVSLAALAEYGDEVDAVWGHSQGAILLGFAAAQGILDPKGPLGFLKEKKLIINGASWPRPYETELAAVKSQSGSLETLHVLGASDDINPPEHAIRLAAVFRGETFVHDGGHYVPADDAALKKYRAFLLNERERADAPAVLPEVDDEPGPMIDKLFSALAHPSAKTVVQLYLEFPAAAHKVLKGFAKPALSVGESARVTFSLSRAKAAAATPAPRSATARTRRTTSSASSRAPGAARSSPRPSSRPC